VVRHLSEPGSTAAKGWQLGWRKHQGHGKAQQKKQHRPPHPHPSLAQPLENKSMVRSCPLLVWNLSRVLLREKNA